LAQDWFFRVFVASRQAPVLTIIVRFSCAPPRRAFASMPKVIMNWMKWAFVALTCLESVAAANDPDACVAISCFEVFAFFLVGFAIYFATYARGRAKLAHILLNSRAGGQQGVSAAEAMVTDTKVIDDTYNGVRENLYRISYSFTAERSDGKRFTAHVNDRQISYNAYKTVRIGKCTTVNYLRDAPQFCKLESEAKEIGKEDVLGCYGISVMLMATAITLFLIGATSYEDNECTDKSPMIVFSVGTALSVWFWIKQEKMYGASCSLFGINFGKAAILVPVNSKDGYDEL